MTREEERLLLRKNINHYLWNKPRCQWTAQDLKNLEGNITSENYVKMKELKKRPNKQPVLVKTEEGTQEFATVILCATKLELEPSYIYARLNGQAKNTGKYQFFKIQNQ